MMKRKSSALLALVMTVMMSVSVFSGCKKQEIENVPVDTTPVASVGDTWDCPSCGQADVSSKFCPNCGEAKDWTCPSRGQAGVTTKFCPNCGTKIEEEMPKSFCPNCGTKVL